MSKTTTKMPPPDTNGELKLAMLALNHCRKELEVLPATWQAWVVDSLMASRPLTDEEAE